MTRMPFGIFLGLRYLKPKRTFVSAITLISLAGVTIGVWVLIVVIAVMSGFDHELRERLMSFQPHVTVESRGLIRNSDELLTKIKSVPRVVDASPFVLGPVLIEFAQQAATPFMRGIDTRHDIFRDKIQRHVIAGNFDLDGEKVLVGSELASRLGIYAGDKITVYSPRNLEKKGEEVYLPLDLEVTGIFSSGMFELDVSFILVSLETAQDLYGLHNEVNGIDIVTDDPIVGANDVKHALNDQLPSPYTAQTWADRNQQFLGAVQVEKLMMYIILMFIILVASFGIASTLITVTVLKTREIGVLKALGTSSWNIMQVFLLQGLVLGIGGVAVGLTLGVVTTRNINLLKEFLANAMGIEVFPREIYQFSEIPVLMTSSDLVTICGCALAICTFAGVVPAFRAARLEPVEALRNE